MSETIPFAPSDGWLLHAILLAAKDGEATLEDVVATADMIEHAMLTFDEIDGGLARLARAGLVSTNGTRLVPGASVAALRSRLEHLPLREATAALRVELGIPEPVPPFKPTPPDPAWRSGVFTRDDLAKAEKAYQRKFWRAYKQQGPGLKS